MENAVSNYSIGEVAAVGELENLLGTVKHFPDRDYSVAAQTPLTGLQVECIWVRNGEATDAITAGLALKWVSGYVGKRVEIAGDGDPSCGAANAFLPTAGAAAGQGFFMVVRGPSKLKSDGGGTLAVNEIVVTAANGEVNKQTAAPADTTAAMVQVNSVVGRVLDTSVTAAAQLFRALIGPPRL